MYKTKQKEEFISLYIKDKALPENALINDFTFTEPFEEEKGKDISCFNKEEIIEVLKERKYIAIYSLLNLVSHLNMYTIFVMETGKENIKHNYYKDITRSDIKKCRDIERVNEIIISREALTNIQNELLNNTDKAILECLFHGIAGKRLDDLTNVCKEQIDERGMCLNLRSGKSIPLDVRLYKMLIDAFNEDELISYSPDSRSIAVYGIGSLYKPRHNTMYEDTEHKFRWVMRRVSLIRSYFGLKTLNMKTVSLSGLVHVIKAGMNETGLSRQAYIQTAEGKRLMEIWDISSINVLNEKIKWYVE